MKEFKEVLIELSNNCNLSCKMCGYGKLRIDKKRFMTKNLFEKIIKDVGDKTQAIRLNGRGESTIHPYFIDILAFVRKELPDVSINLFTNLSFDNNAIIKAFKDNDVQLFISMDSPEEEELERIRSGCNYNLLMNNISNLSDMNVRPFLVFTIMEDNLDRIYDIAEFALRNNLNIIYNTVRYDKEMEYFLELVQTHKGEIKNQFDRAYHLYLDTELKFIYPDQISGIKFDTNSASETYGEKKRCPSLDSQVCILYNGLVTPCNMFNPYVYGNIEIQSIKEVWNSDKRKYFINNYKKHYYCNNCACMG